MPLFEFRCEPCNFEFEELSNKNAGPVECRKCGKEAQKKMSSFSSVVVGSTNESVDVKIGRAASKRWELHHERQAKRRKGKKIRSFDVPKIDGKYAPAMALGSKEQIEKRKEYSVILQEHRKQRVNRGQSQFSGTGDF